MAHPSHVPSGHEALTQSLREVHALPVAQRGQLPPQSISLSSPFLMPSLQLGAGGDETGDRCFFLCFFLWCLAVVSVSPSRPSAPPTTAASAPRRERALLRSREKLSKRRGSMVPPLTMLER